VELHYLTECSSLRSRIRPTTVFEAASHILLARALSRPSKLAPLRQTMSKSCLWPIFSRVIRTAMAIAAGRLTQTR
jgi:hypothetical protein